MIYGLKVFSSNIRFENALYRVEDFSPKNDYSSKGSSICLISICSASSKPISSFAYTDRVTKRGLVAWIVYLLEGGGELGEGGLPCLELLLVPRYLVAEI